MGACAAQGVASGRLVCLCRHAGLSRMMQSSCWGPDGQRLSPLLASVPEPCLHPRAGGLACSSCGHQRRWEARAERQRKSCAPRLAGLFPALAAALRVLCREQPCGAPARQTVTPAGLCHRCAGSQPASNRQGEAGKGAAGSPLTNHTNEAASAGRQTEPCWRREAVVGVGSDAYRAGQQPPPVPPGSPCPVPPHIERGGSTRGWAMPLGPLGTALLWPWKWQ